MDLYFSRVSFITWRLGKWYTLCLTSEYIGLNLFLIFEMINKSLVLLLRIYHPDTQLCFILLLQVLRGDGATDLFNQPASPGLKLELTIVSGCNLIARDKNGLLAKTILINCICLNRV